MNHSPALAPRTSVPLIAFLSLFMAANAIAGAGHWTLVGSNNLGMHCMDDDYSVFSILPPFNTVNAQLIDAQGRLVTSASGITFTYEGVADPNGSINTTAAGKTNFYDYAQPLFGAALQVDQGLAGFNMPGLANTPQPMAFDPAFNWFSATGIPITPVDDYGGTNTYPLMKLSAKNAAGTVLATANLVLPVSSEVDCRGCHAPNANADAMPQGGWIDTGNAKRDHRLNILLFHDQDNAAKPAYAAALQAKGYDAAGLYATATHPTNPRPILCAACHASEALGTPSFGSIKPLTASVHGFHADVTDPKTGLKLNDSANRASCYQCHPGSTTKCLRGAMGSAVATDGTMAMQCQSCHGSMSDVGATTRTGWLDEPNCQSCHTGTATSNSGQIVFDSVFDAPGHVRIPQNLTFATNPNTPAAGKSLFRFSKGHGGLQCESCHGATHAEFPTWTDNDNLFSKQTQGHIGKLAECTACHATMPNTVTGGPHGLHPLGQSWVSRHHDLVEHGGAGNCQTCHGADYRGTRLSRAQGDRLLRLDDDGGGAAKRFWRGQTIGCYDCHNGPRGGEDGGGRRPVAPVVRSASLVVTKDVPKTLTIVASGAGTLTLRVVTQPLHGTIGLNGRVATFYPDPGYTGPDSFTFAASNSFVESNLGAAKVSVVGSINGKPDFVPPRMTKILPANRAKVSAAQFTVSGTAADANGIALVEYRIGAGPWRAATGTKVWSAVISGVPAGTLAMSFRATDAAGNRSAVLPRTYAAK